MPTSYRALASIIERAEALSVGTAITYQSGGRKQLLPLFEGLDLIKPGVVLAPLWRPESRHDLFLDRSARSADLVGVARSSETRRCRSVSAHEPNTKGSRAP